MCSNTSLVALAIATVIGLIYVSEFGNDEVFVSTFSDSFDDYCQENADTSYSDPTVVIDAFSCDPKPTSKISCCAVNPVIRSQMEKMKGSSCANSADCPCLPNIGSFYLGATVATTRDTKPYKHPLGTPASERTNQPVLAIKPKPVTVGKNWHFKGVGALVVKMFYPAHISGFAVIHPKKCQLPNGYETSTPKSFHVMGMNDANTSEPFVFGNYTYNINGSEAQFFPVQNCSPEKYKFIEFRFTSNYGNANYTSVYKVRIHGDIGPPPYQSAETRENGGNASDTNRTYGFNG